MCEDFEPLGDDIEDPGSLCPEIKGAQSSQHLGMGTWQASVELGDGSPLAKGFQLCECDRR